MTEQTNTKQRIDFDPDLYGCRCERCIESGRGHETVFSVRRTGRYGHEYTCQSCGATTTRKPRKA